MDSEECIISLGATPRCLVPILPSLNHTLLLDYPSTTVEWPDSPRLPELPDSPILKFGWAQLYRAGKYLLIRVRVSKPLFRNDTNEGFQHVFLLPRFVNTTVSELLFKDRTGANILIPLEQGRKNDGLYIVAWAVAMRYPSA